MKNNIVDQGGWKGHSHSTSYRLLYKHDKNTPYSNIMPGSSPDVREDYSDAVITCNINRQYCHETIMFSDGAPDDSKIGLFNLCDDNCSDNIRCDNKYILTLQKNETPLFIQQVQQQILKLNINMIKDLCKIIAEYSVKSYNWETIKEYTVIGDTVNINWDKGTDSEGEEYFLSYGDNNAYKGVLELSWNITMNLSNEYYGDIKVKSIIMPLL